METDLVLRPFDPTKPAYQFTLSGATSVSLMLTSWRVMESVKAIAITLPEYSPGTNPLTSSGPASDALADPILLLDQSPSQT